MLRKSLLFITVHFLLGLGLVAAQAQTATNFPTKPVHFIVPFPPGQATDMIARLVADSLTKTWGQQVIVENKPGIPGMLAGKAAAPDGYTMTIGTSGMLVVNPSVYDKLAYDTAKDYVFIGGLAITPMAIVVSASLPFNTLPELIAAAKQNPGKFNVGYGGVNNTQHLTGEYFKYVTGVNMVGITYKGSANAVTDLLGGQISILVDSVATTLPHIKSGKFKALAVTTLERVPQLPNVPTVAELGFPGFESIGWQGLILPKGTPPEIVAKISSDVAKIMSDPQMQERLVEKGMVPDMRGAKEWSKFVFSELAKWKEAAQRANIKATD